MSQFDCIAKDIYTKCVEDIKNELMKLNEIELVHVKRDNESVEFFVKGGKDCEIAKIIHDFQTSGFELNLTGENGFVVESYDGTFKQIRYTEVL